MDFGRRLYPEAPALGRGGDCRHLSTIYLPPLPPANGLDGGFGENLKPDREKRSPYLSNKAHFGGKKII